MKKGNMIDLEMHRRERQDAKDAESHVKVSEELEKAIELLILRLKESGPVVKSS
jgi:hypothetical protein